MVGLSVKCLIFTGFVGNPMSDLVKNLSGASLLPVVFALHSAMRTNFALNSPTKASEDELTP